MKTMGYTEQNCCLCTIAGGEEPNGQADRILWETGNYFAVSSLGAFIEGWILIASKTHRLSFASKYDDPEFLQFASYVRCKVESQYGNTIQFEHGPGKQNSKLGCGVDHAHLHIVPFSQSLVPDLLRRGLEWNQLSNCDLAAIPESDTGYYFYTDSITPNGFNGYYCNPRMPVSQFFRKLLAKKVETKYFDYKEFPFIARALRTYSNLKTHDNSMPMSATE